MRIEDLDRPRVVPGSTDRILHTLEAFGFEWDEAVVYQSRRATAYEAMLHTLRARGLTYECTCSRAQLADEEPYPGHCRIAPRRAGVATATRLRVEPGYIVFKDRIQGMFRQDVARVVGDFVLRRRDQLFAYVMAVVVDDHAQGVTHVVRGADLLDNTPRQIYLHRLLGLPPPDYAHVPVLTEADGRKLAKSARSVRIDTNKVAAQLQHVFDLLQLKPPAVLRDAKVTEAWTWALSRWVEFRVSARLSQPINA